MDALRLTAATGCALAAGGHARRARAAAGQRRRSRRSRRPESGRRRRPCDVRRHRRACASRRRRVAVLRGDPPRLRDADADRRRRDLQRPATGDPGMRLAARCTRATCRLPAAADDYAYLTVNAVTKTTVTASPKLADPGEAMKFVATASPRPQPVGASSTDDYDAAGCSRELPGRLRDRGLQRSTASALAACVDRPVDAETGVATCGARRSAAGGAPRRDRVLLRHRRPWSPRQASDDFAVKAPAATVVGRRARLRRRHGRRHAPPARSR